MQETISFRVVKEPYGWAVRLGDGLMTPFPSEASALDHANGCAEALRRQGVRVEVLLQKSFTATSQRSRTRFPFLLR